jgi:hypothetical protein
MAESSPYIWLIDDLAYNFPQLRIWTYGYSPQIQSQTSGQDVYEFADSFVRLLRGLRQKFQVSTINSCFAKIYLTLKSSPIEAPGEHTYSLLSSQPRRPSVQGCKLHFAGGVQMDKKMLTNPRLS